MALEEALSPSQPRTRVRLRGGHTLVIDGSLTHWAGILASTD